MMRVALLGPANSIHLQRWAAALAQRGYELCIISQHRCERARLPASVEVVWLPYVGPLGYFRNVPSLRRLLATWRPDLLSAHYASGYGTLMALSGFRPLMLSVWGSDVYDFPYESALKGRLVRRNLRRANVIASTSHAMAEQVRRLAPERSEVAVTPFGVDLEQFSPQPWRRARGQLTIGIVKSLTPKYGVDLLLRAFAGLLNDKDVCALHDQCRLLIVGGGLERNALESLASELGVASCVRFAGAVPHADVPLWLNQFDIYVAPSRLDSESFGVAVVEASACALPVVVTAVGGLQEVVRDRETGLVVPQDDVPALQAALKCLVLDAALRNNLGKSGRLLVEREYEWGHCVDLMEACFAQAVAVVESS